MTENKRFGYNVNKNSIEYDGKHFAYCNSQQSKITNKLNELHEENQKLDSEIKSYIHALNVTLKEKEELYNENDTLKEELKTKCIVNKQYEENQRLTKMLDNVANYMQKQHKDMPIDDFVEWWNNIATEGL